MRTGITALLMVLGFATGAQALDIQITMPQTQSGVPMRPSVEGKVSDPKAQVFVIVNPLETPDQFWVQPPVVVQPDGKWRAVIYIGRPGSIDVGKRFEIRAVANPKHRLKEADVVGGWPEAEAASSVIQVQRR